MWGDPETAHREMEPNRAESQKMKQSHSQKTPKQLKWLTTTREITCLIVISAPYRKSYQGAPKGELSGGESLEGKAL